METTQERRQDAEFRIPNASGLPGDAPKPAVQARQGNLSGRVFSILLAGVILVIAGFAISYLVVV